MSSEEPSLLKRQKEIEPRKNSGIRLGKRTEGGSGRARFRGVAISNKYGLRNNKNKQHMKNEVNRAQDGQRKTFFPLVAKKKLLIMTVIMTSLVMVSCNVTRTITNQSEYYQRGDTSVVIQTKTVETYDASKR